MPFCIFGEALVERSADGRDRIGGAPFNVAWHLSAFGETPRLRSAVGEDPEGQQVRDAMAGWGMDQSGLLTDPLHPTGEVRAAATGGPAPEVPPWRAFDYIRPIRRGLRCDLLYHGTLALRGPESATALAAIKDAGAGQVFLDCNLCTPWWSTAEVLAQVAGADWVKLSRAEFGLLTGVPESLPERALAERAAQFRAAYGLTGLILTLGVAGSLTLTATGPPLWTRPAAPVEPLDPAGAGDALAAVVLLGLRRGWPLPLTLERAQAFASRILAQPGAIAADPGLYEPFIDRWELAPAVPAPRSPVAVVAPRPRRRPRVRRVSAGCPSA